MNTVPIRIVIYAKDVVNITGLSPRSARHLLSVIRKKLGKPPFAFVTIEEFAAATGIKEEHIRSFLH